MSILQEIVAKTLNNYLKSRPVIERLVQDAEQGVKRDKNYDASYYIQKKASYFELWCTQDVNRAEIVYALRQALTTDYQNDDLLHAALCDWFSKIEFSRLDRGHALYDEMIKMFQNILNGNISFTNKKLQFHNAFKAHLLMRYKCLSAGINVDYKALISALSTAAGSGSMLVRIAETLASIHTLVSTPQCRVITETWGMAQFSVAIDTALGLFHSQEKGFFDQFDSSTIGFLVYDAVDRLTSCLEHKPQDKMASLPQEILNALTETFQNVCSKPEEAQSKERVKKTRSFEHTEKEVARESCTRASKNRHLIFGGNRVNSKASSEKLLSPAKRD